MVSKVEGESDIPLTNLIPISKCARSGVNKNTLKTAIIMNRVCVVDIFISLEIIISTRIAKLMQHLNKFELKLNAPV